MRRPILANGIPLRSIGAVLRPRSADIIDEHRHAGTAVAVVANSKGGCGKSTLVLNMAMGYVLQDKRVLVVDADTGQRTVGKWPRAVGLCGPTVVSWQTVDILDKLAKVINQYDVVLVDFAGRDDRAVAPLIAVADILISPSKPSQQDLQELACFIRVAKAKGVPHIVILNEATREATDELARLVAEFSQFKPYLPVAIQQLTGYRRAYSLGRSVLEYNGAHPAKENFRRVFTQIDAVIRKARANAGMALS
jgi:chromosome partitioning protein